MKINDVKLINESLMILKNAGLIEFTITKINDDLADDIINITIIPDGWSFANLLQYLNDNSLRHTLH